VQNIQAPLEITKIKSGMRTFDSPALALTPSEKQTPAAEKPQDDHTFTFIHVDDAKPSPKSNKPLSLPVFRKRQPNSRSKFLSM
tara:strand:+ start:94 stop:345 length:252 start_codon:yes stop_codon:yes gene_type:complete